MLIAERRFIIDASRERIWELIDKALFNTLELERMSVIDEHNIAALVPVKLGPLRIPMDLRVEIIDASPLQALVARLHVKSKGGIVGLTTQTAIQMISAGDEKTEVVCEATMDRMNALSRALMLWKIRGFSAEVFEGVRKYLERMA